MGQQEKIDLPDGGWALLRPRGELTERAARRIDLASMVAAGVSAKLEALGFDPERSETWAVYAQLSPEEYEAHSAYQAVVISRMVAEWSGGAPPSEEEALDLPRAVFQPLAAACVAALAEGESFEPDPDPTPPGGGSSGSETT